MIARRLMGVAFASICAASCASRHEDNPAPKSAPAPVVQSAAPKPITISDRNVGPIEPMTVAEVATLAPLFPDCAVIAETGDSSVVVVSRGGKDLLVIHRIEDRSHLVSAIDTLSSNVPGPYGIRVGDHFGSVFKFGKPDCEWGTHDGDITSEFILCHLPGEPAVQYRCDITNVPESEVGDLNQAPSDKILKEATIRSIRWDPETAWIDSPHAAAAAVALPAELVDHGYGPIDSSTTMDARIVGPMFPGTTVTNGEDRMEDYKVANTLTLHRNGVDLLILHSAGPDSRAIASVEILSKEVEGPHGIHVGSLFDQLLKQTPKEVINCQDGEEQLDGKVFCNLSGSPRFVFSGTIGDPDHDDNGNFKPDALKALQIESISWIAHAPVAQGTK